MELINLTAILFSAATTFYLVYTDVFEPVRKYGGQLFYCPLCLGFWIGLGFYSVVSPYDTFKLLFLAFMHGFLTGILAFSFYLLVEWVEAFIDRYKRD